MDKRNLLTGFGVLTLVIFGLYFYTRETPRVKVEGQPNKMVQARIRELAVKPKPLAMQPTAKSQGPESPLSAQMKINVQLMAKLNPAFVAANPGVNFKSMTPADVARLVVPRDSSLMVLRNPACGRASAQALGKVSDPTMGASFENLESPKFVSVKTDSDQTIGDLDKKVAKDDCTLGVFANGSIDDVRIPAAKDLQARLAAQPVENVSAFDATQALKEGTALVEKSIYDGRPTAAQVYMAGSSPETFGVSENSDASEPIKGESIGGGAGQLYVLPLPSSSAPSQQIADANNAVIAAIAHGADFVLLPAVDPDVFAAVAKLASEHNVKVYMVPRDTPALPTGLIDPPKNQSGSSTSK